MNKRTVNYSLILAGILSFAGLFLFFSTISFLIQGAGFDSGIHFLSRPGGFFYIAFNWLSFIIPGYLFLSSYFLLKKSFKKEYLILQGLAVLPFLTLTAITKLSVAEPFGISPIKRMFADSIGIIPGIIVLFLLLIMEGLFFSQVYKQVLNKKQGSIRKKIREYILSNLSALDSPEENNKQKIQQDNEYSHDRILKQRMDTERFLNEKSSHTGSYEEKQPDEFFHIKTGNEFIPEPDTVREYKENPEVRTEKNEVPVYDAMFSEPQNHESDIEELECVDQEEEFIEQDENKEIQMLQNRNSIAEAKNKIKPETNISSSKKREYYIPVDELLEDYEDGEYWKIDTETKQYGEILMNTLMEFNISAELTGIRKGPVITMFEILPSPGVKLSKIVGLADNIALRLAASRVRIVAPIPGKQAVGIEIPNKKRSIVSFKELINLNIFKKSRYELPIILGKDISGEAQIIDLVQTPHLLIAGATGSGKSVCVNSLITSLLFKKTPEEVRLLLIDPKMVELKMYNDIPHLLTPVITEPKHSFQALQYCLYEMERRYSLLDSIGVRDILSFNKKIKEKNLTADKLPHIVIVIDEFADLMATTGKELEATISRLASMSRAVGIHLVLATQRPSVDVITGLIKANIPCRIAFMVASKFDSRIIIDSVGAEKLLGQGDMLFASAWDPVPVRIQGSFLSEEEVENITDYLKTLGEPDYIDDEIFFDDEDENIYNSTSDDPMMERALNIIINSGKASTSYLQRRLKIGYNRAARLMEELEARGIVGPPNGSKPREILHVPALD